MQRSLLILLTVVLLAGSAMAQYKVLHLGSPYNTTGSETNALRVGDTIFSYATLAANTSGSGSFGVKHNITQLQQARIARNGKIGRPKPNRWGFNSKKDHTGNLALDPVTYDAYFTRSDVGTHRSDIYFARHRRRGWEKPNKLQGPINDSRYTSTHPTLGRLDDSTAILYFVSDREGGLGGMDIWYAVVRNGVAGEPHNLGPQVNSPYDEYTPFYDQRNGVLYFSSDRPGGQGGFDIYSAVGFRNTWQAAVEVCHCLNSPQNDLYFIISDHDSATGIPTRGYLSSNRADSFFINDSMCCNDLYQWSIDTATLLAEQPTPPQPEPVADTLPSLSERVSRFFPLFLYFHNDDPDPRSLDTSTLADYADCQRRYVQLRSQYLAHQASSADSVAISTFFDSSVVGNYEKVETLLDYIEEQLDEGHSVRLTISGYASPLYRQDYNYRLSQRRIQSFINLLLHWRGGMFEEALSSHRIIIVHDPRGAVPPTPVSDAADPVYSLPAAEARRIEISRCEIL